MASTLGTNYFPATPFTYEAFIEELRGFADAPRSFAAAECNVSSAVFKGWKRRVEGTLRHVVEIGYPRPKCDIGTREFLSLWDDEPQKTFFDALTDTVDELRLIIEHFERYGAPKLASDRNEAVPFSVDPLAHVSGVLADQAAPSAATAVVAAPALNPLVLPAAEKMTWVWAKTHVPVSWWWKGVLAAGALLVAGFTAGKYADSVDKAMHSEVLAAPAVKAPTASQKK
jgi:hypothetical protein